MNDIKNNVNSTSQNTNDQKFVKIHSSNNCHHALGAHCINKDHDHETNFIIYVSIAAGIMLILIGLVYMMSVFYRRKKEQRERNERPNDLPDF